MFNFFRNQKRGEIDFELSSNPAILFNQRVSVNQLFLFGVSLGDSYSCIMRYEIATTSMEPPPKNLNTRSIFRNDKRYYFVDEVETEYLLSDRIDAVIENDGWLHMKTGAKYRIKNKMIVEFSLYGEILNYFRGIPKETIKTKFGKPDKIIKHPEEIDGTLLNTDLIYFKRKVRIYYQDWDKEIISINIGDTLIDYKNYR